MQAGDLTRRPYVLGPHHLRLDWLIWFAAMNDQLRDPWVLHLVWKLLDRDKSIRKLLAVDPFDGAVPLCASAGSSITSSPTRARP